MKLTKSVMFVAVVALTMGGVAFANPYASKLNAPSNAVLNSSITIDYFLNQEAETVEVNIYNDTPALVRTLDASEAVAAAQPGTATGANSVVWDTKDDGGSDLPVGSYTYEVVAAESVGYATWTMIARTPMYSPRGARVNRDPNSPTFGLFYVTNHSTGTSVNPGAIEQKHGVYIYNPDFSPAPGTTNGYAAGNVAFDSVYGSPWNVQFDEENSVYMCDWGTTSPTVVKGDMYYDNTFALLDYDAGSACQWVDSIALDGVGANRVLYALDDSYDHDSADWYYGNFHTWQYDIGETASLYTATPSRVLLNPSAWTAPIIYPWDINVDGDTVYMSDYRNPGQGPRCYAFDISSSKLTDGTPLAIIWSSTPSNTFFSNVSMGDLNDDGTLLVYGSRTNTISGRVGIFSATDGTLLDVFIAGNDRTRCACWDFAGNVYETNNIDEWLRLWAPAGPSSTATPGPAPIVLQTVTGIEGTHWSIFR